MKNDLYSGAIDALTSMAYIASLGFTAAFKVALSLLFGAFFGSKMFVLRGFAREGEFLLGNRVLSTKVVDTVVCEQHKLSRKSIVRDNIAHFDETACVFGGNFYNSVLKSMLRHKCRGNLMIRQIFV